MLHQPRSFLRLTGIIAFAMMTLLASAGASNIYAQDTVAIQSEEADVINVRAALCNDAACGEYTSYVEPGTINAVDEETGEVLGSCTNQTGNQDPFCGIDFDSSIPHVFTWDEAEVPDGYTYIGERIEDTTPSGDPLTTFAFVADNPSAAESIQVVVGLCDDASCRSFSEFLPEFLVMTVVDDRRFSSCFTGSEGEDHYCAVDVPEEGAWDFDWIPSATPEGYAYVGEPLLLEETPGGPIYALAFIPDETAVNPPDDDVDDEPITGLPDTGGGPAVSRVDSDTAFIALAIFTGATLVTASRVVCHGTRR